MSSDPGLINHIAHATDTAKDLLEDIHEERMKQ